MRMISTGKQRNRGYTRHFVHSDWSNATPAKGGTPGDPPSCIRILIEGDRSYRLFLTPADVVAHILTLPSSAIAEAVKEIADGKNGTSMAAKIPELVKQLTTGALLA